VKDVIKVTKGCTTPNFSHNHVHLTKDSVDDACCFSVVGHDRSWDLKCDSPGQRDVIVRGVQLLRRSEYEKRATMGCIKGGFTRQQSNTVHSSTVGAGAHRPESDTSSDDEGGDQHGQ
jgi:hypothetical protein